MTVFYCICGAETTPENPFCSDRCKYIMEMMNTPRGQRIDNLDRAIKIFGKQYDTDHGISP